MSLEYQFVSFYLGENLFGLNIIHVREVIQNFEITPVEGTSSLIKGVLNLRGQIVTVLSPAVRLGFEEKKEGSEKVCIVLKTTSELKRTVNDENSFMEEDTSSDWLGLIVDRMADVITVKEEDIDSPPANFSAIDSKFLTGVVNMDNDLLILVKISEIVSPEKS